MRATKNSLQEREGCFLFDLRAKTGSGTAKLLRGHARFTVEDAAEVAAIREAHVERNFHDGFLAVLEQGFCLVDAIALQVFDGSCAQFLAEAECQVILGNVDVPGNRLA